MRIGIDLDEVAIDFINGFLDFYHMKTGKLHNREEFSQFDSAPVFKITNEENNKLHKEFHEIHKIEELKPKEEAVESINKLAKNNELFIITGRPIHIRDKTKGWVEHHIKRNIEIIHSSDFHKEQGETKAEICSRLGVNVMLEDHRNIALQCADSGIKVLLFDSPWNKGLEHENIKRIGGWREALNEIEGMK